MSPINGSALLDHILSQTKANVEFLIAQNHISSDAGREILNRLPTPSRDAVHGLTENTRNLNLSSGSGYSPSGGPPQSSYPPPSNGARAKAIWGYNEEGSDPNDLSFRPGDIIEIVAETNKDWWTGRNNGREGLFPSNYVEKLPPMGLPPKPERGPSTYNNYGHPSGPPPPSHAPVPHYAPPPGPPGPPGPGYAPPYRPPMGYQGPPPPQQYHAPPYASPPPVPASAPPAPEVKPQKESKFGGMGNTLAHSAAGGLGFGAGSAVGSNLVNSIF
ncbi:hypothetical protein V5O48_006887 [Marasmius crinis-equi]|uniref:SH3 domain-containing protein n=1 Tax=Marasmius crinis-equi TaxID=585013 RepID=A0ABR3FIA5_9AGAR